MTPEQLEAIRVRAEGNSKNTRPTDPLWCHECPKIAAEALDVAESDRTALLAHLSALAPVPGAGAPAIGRQDLLCEIAHAAFHLLEDQEQSEQDPALLKAVNDFIGDEESDIHPLLGDFRRVTSATPTPDATITSQASVAPDREVVVDGQAKSFLETYNYWKSHEPVEGWSKNKKIPRQHTWEDYCNLAAALAQCPQQQITEAVAAERELLQACGVIEEIVGSKLMQKHDERFEVHAYTVRDGEYNDYRMLRKHHLVRIANAAAAIRTRSTAVAAGDDARDMAANSRDLSCEQTTDVSQSASIPDASKEQ